MPKQAYIQAPVTDETFAEYNTHRKELRQTWLEYLLSALAQYKAAHPAPDAPPDAPPSEGPADKQPDTDAAKKHKTKKGGK